MRNITRITIAAAATRMPTAHSTIDHHEGRCRGRGRFATGRRTDAGLATTTAGRDEAAGRATGAATAAGAGEGAGDAAGTADRGAASVGEWMSTPICWR